jgi:hypothetical protein
MKSRDIADTLQELGRLFDFYKELKDCNFKMSNRTNNKLNISDENCKYNRLDNK